MTAKQRHVTVQYLFAPIPEAVLYDSISDKAVRIYGTLMRHGLSPDDCYPGHPRIAQLIGCSERSVQRPLRELEESGWVDRVPRFRDDGGRDTDGFVVRTAKREGAHVCAGTAQDSAGAPRIPPAHSSAMNERRNESKMNETTTTPAVAGVDPKATIILGSEVVPVDWNIPDVAVEAGLLGEALRLSRIFARQLADRGEPGRDPMAKAAGKRWVLPFEAMLRIDRRDPAHVERVMHWLDTGTDAVAVFWRPNIRSPEKLRAQWARMAEQYENRVKRGSDRQMALTEGAAAALVSDPRRSRGPARGSALPLGQGGEP